MSVTIPGPLVAYLRAGLKREIGSGLAILQCEIEGDLDPEKYSTALARLWTASALFELIGLEDRSDQPDIEVNLGDSAHLLVKALDTQYQIEVQRLQNATDAGYRPLERGVPDLGVLVSVIQHKVCASSPDGPWM